MIAVHIQGVAVAWQIYQLTKDPLSLGLIGFYSVMPTILISLFAGHLTDKLVRRNLLLGAQLLALTCLGMLLYTAHDSTMLVSNKVNFIYAAVALGGIARAFVSPTQFAMFGEIVPMKERVEGMAWSSSVWQFAAAGGPALAGFLYGFGGATTTYVFALTMMLMAILFNFSIAPKSLPKMVSKEPFFKSLFVGVRFIFSNKLVLAALSLDMFAVLCGGAVALLPIFADILGVGAEGLGILRGAPFVGATVVALWIVRNPLRKHAGIILLGSVACYALCIIGFGVSRNFSLSFFMLFLSGAFDQISVVVRGTILQLLTPDNMRGRVSAVNQIFIASSNEIGEMRAGVSAKFFGTVPAVVIGGAMALGVVGLVTFFSTPMRQLNLGKMENEEVK
jgi:MFS family permease